MWLCQEVNLQFLTFVIRVAESWVNVGDTKSSYDMTNYEELKYVTTLKYLSHQENIDCTS